MITLKLTLMPPSTILKDVFRHEMEVLCLQSKCGTILVPEGGG